MEEIAVLWLIGAIITLAEVWKLFPQKVNKAMKKMREKNFIKFQMMMYLQKPVAILLIALIIIHTVIFWPIVLIKKIIE